MSHLNGRFLAVRKGEAGVSLIETAFVASIFLVLFFAIWDFAFMCYAKATMENAVRTAARYAITGNCSNPNNGCFNGQNQQGRLQTIVNLVSNYSWAFTPTVSVSCVQGGCGSVYGSGGNNAGGPGDLVQVTATYVYHPIILQILYSNGQAGTQMYTFTVSSTFKNETFMPPAS
ncbi:MAG TPA: TadE/TadG family type IV pilus assembly protein [Candidatus Bathyarchaeia archaeon]|nr:TadE/TadG family type IV pilus assembly protein [Candidatus Bathyarchaeia archaeon]